MKIFLVMSLLLTLGFCSCFTNTGMEYKAKDLKGDPLIIDAADELILLTIYRSDCSACDLLLEHPAFENFDAKKVNIDLLENDNNKLLSQVFWIQAFPSTYFITKDYDIIGITEGPTEFVKYADSICNSKIKFENIGMREIEKDSVLPLLSYSLKALRYCQEENIAAAKNNALLSLRRGSYFFNNYLLYKIYQAENKTDSVNFYKRRALRHSHHVNDYIYDDLIIELNKSS